MRCHARRVVVYAVGCTCIIAVLLSISSRTSSDSRAGRGPLPGLFFDASDVGQPRRAADSIHDRLAKYGIGGRDPTPENAHNEGPPKFARPPPEPKRPPTTTSSSNAAAPGVRQLDELSDDERLVYATDDGAGNERYRATYVRRDTGRPPTSTSVWWSTDDSPDDRILAQMRYVPKNYRADDGQQLKVIYVPSGLGGTPPGRQKFVEENCPVDACTLTVDQAFADTAAMRLLQADAVFGPSTRKPPGQIWTVYVLESPANTGQFHDARDLVNWTATYRWDSTIVTPYEKFVPFANASHGRRRHRRAGSVTSSAKHRRTTVDDRPLMQTPNDTLRRNYAAGKTKMVAWFVSNCGPKNLRGDYASELARYVNVDIYGACGPLSCVRTEDRCTQLLDNDYKFYLSFENSNCDYYITEKFFQWGLQYNVIPIVMGARKQDYLRAAPPHSFIHVEDFPSPRELAKYLHRLDQSDELYNEYFAWKGTGEFINTKFWCRLCAMLHDDNKPQMWYADFEQWWSHSGACRRDRWDQPTTL